jgi:hypothetical protein
MAEVRLRVMIDPDTAEIVFFLYPDAKDENELVVADTWDYWTEEGETIPYSLIVRMEVENDKVVRAEFEKEKVAFIDPSQTLELD